MLVFECDMHLTEEAIESLKAQCLSSMERGEPLVLTDGIKLKNIGPYVVVNKHAAHQTISNETPLKVYGPYLERSDAKRAVGEKAGEFGGEWCIVRCEEE